MYPCEGRGTVWVPAIGFAEVYPERRRRRRQRAGTHNLQITFPCPTRLDFGIGWSMNAAPCSSPANLPQRPGRASRHISPHGDGANFVNFRRRIVGVLAENTRVTATIGTIRPRASVPRLGKMVAHPKTYATLSVPSPPSCPLLRAPILLKARASDALLWNCRGRRASARRLNR